MYNICVCCLASDRKLHPLDALWDSFLIITQNYMLPQYMITICWECKAFFKRFELFKKKTLHSFSLLQQYSDLRKIKEHQKIKSSLTISPVKVIDNMTLGLSLKETEELIDNKKTQIPIDPQIDFMVPMVSGITFDSTQIRRPISRTIESDQCMEVAQTVEIKEEETDCMIDCIIENPQPHGVNDDGATCSEDIKDPALIENSIFYCYEEPSEHKMQNDYGTKWTYELVNDQQLQEWRRQDKNDSRYMRMYNKCTSCLMIFNSENQLQVHNLKNHLETLGTHVCDICRTRFPEEASMTEHRRSHFMLYKCLLCEFETREFDILKKHLSEEHIEDTWKCDTCGEIFKTRSRLRNHVYTHQEKVQCKECDKMVPLRQISCHMSINHGNLPEAQCPVCKKIYKNKYVLKKHMETHEEAKETYYCVLCKIHFRNVHSYKNHLRSSIKHLHPEELKHNCEECGRRFITAERMQTHYDRVHLKIQKYACDKCSKSYATQRKLRAHVSKTHDGTYVEPPKGKICDFCGKGFRTFCALRIHINTHTGERPYECKLCPSTFSQPSCLSTHIKLVHEKIDWKLLKKNNTRKGQKGKIKKGKRKRSPKQELGE